MKTIFLLIVITAIMNTYVISQERNTNYHSLVAKKNKRIHRFFVKEMIHVNYKEGNNLRHYKGILMYFSNEGVYLSSFRKKDTILQYIPINSMASVHNLLRKSRLTSVILTGVSLAVTILLLGTDNNNAADDYAFLFAILSASAGAGGSIGFLSTFITEAVNTKSTKHGWRFSLQ